jgi:hypothetical protein
VPVCKGFLRSSTRRWWYYVGLGGTAFLIRELAIRLCQKVSRALPLSDPHSKAHKILTIKDLLEKYGYLRDYLLGF